MTNDEYLANTFNVSSFASNEEFYKAQAEYLLNKLSILQKFSCKIYSSFDSVDVEIGSFNPYSAPHPLCLLESLDRIQDGMRSVL